MVLHNNTDIYNVPFKKGFCFIYPCSSQDYFRPHNWVPKLLHSITITLCLRYTEVDQTFGWARLAMGLSEVNPMSLDWGNSARYGEMKQRISFLITFIILQYISICTA